MNNLSSTAINKIYRAVEKKLTIFVNSLLVEPSLYKVIVEMDCLTSVMTEITKPNPRRMSRLLSEDLSVFSDSSALINVDYDKLDGTCTMHELMSISAFESELFNSGYYKSCKLFKKELSPLQKGVLVDIYKDVLPILFTEAYEEERNGMFIMNIDTKELPLLCRAIKEAWGDNSLVTLREWQPHRTRTELLTVLFWAKPTIGAKADPYKGYKK